MNDLPPICQDCEFIVDRKEWRCGHPAIVSDLETKARDLGSYLSATNGMVICYKWEGDYLPPDWCPIRKIQSTLGNQMDADMEFPQKEEFRPQLKGTHLAIAQLFTELSRGRTLKEIAADHRIDQKVLVGFLEKLANFFNHDL